MEFTGKTLEEAKELALKELGVSEDAVEITVIEQPTKGLFGRLKGKAVIDVAVKQEEKQIKTSKEEGGCTKEETLKFVQDIISMMGFDAETTLKEDEENTVIVVKAENSAEIIGYRGELLDAIQTLAGSKENIGRKGYKKVIVDCENYRDKREDTLIKLANRLEEKATEMRREVILEPMSPYERRIIHTALSASETVTTRSDGKEPNRYVVIVPNDKDEFSKPYNAGRNRNERTSKNDRKGRNDRNRRGGKFDRPQRKQSGFTESARKKTISFGTYLGNSLKDKE